MTITTVEIVDEFKALEGCHTARSAKRDETLTVHEHWLDMMDETHVFTEAELLIHDYVRFVDWAIVDELSWEMADEESVPRSRTERAVKLLDYGYNVFTQH